MALSNSNAIYDMCEYVYQILYVVSPWITAGCPAEFSLSSVFLAAWQPLNIEMIKNCQSSDI